jgi:hypothetical protein
MLVEAAVFKNDNSGVWSRITFTPAYHFRFGAEGIAVKEWGRVFDFFEAKVTDGGTQRSVTNRNAHDQAKGESAIHNSLAEFRMVPAVLFVQMQRRWVVGKRRIKDVVHLS